MPRPVARPFVLVNMSMTADGKIATANRRVATFGSPRDLDHLYALRATADAVLCGAATVNSGEVTLRNGGARLTALRRRRGLSAEPLRVIVSGSGGLRPDAAVFRRGAAPVVVLVGAACPAARRRALEGAGGRVVVFGRREVDLPAALRWLAAEWAVRRLVCEGGGALNAAMFAAGLVDELHLTLCPFVFGGRAAPQVAEGLGATRLAEAAQLRLVSVRPNGDERFLVFRRAAPTVGPARASSSVKSHCSSTKQRRLPKKSHA
ncbi:MAG: RibD family protein [Limisphaerales bacterium]